MENREEDQKEEVKHLDGDEQSTDSGNEAHGAGSDEEGQRRRECVWINSVFGR